MKTEFLLLLLIFFLGCVQIPPPTGGGTIITGYATNSWDHNYPYNYFMVYYQDDFNITHTVGYCFDGNDWNSYEDKRLFLRDSFYSKQGLMFVLDVNQDQPCPDWNINIYEYTIAEAVPVDSNGGV